MKNYTLLLLLLGVTFTCSSQIIWHKRTSGGGLVNTACQVNLDNGQYLINSSDKILNFDRFGTSTGEVQRPTNMGFNNLTAAVLKKYAPGTGNPYFLVAQRSLTGVQGYTLAEHRPGSGYLHAQVFADSLGSLSAYGRPKLIDLGNNTFMAFGRQFFRKIEFSQASGFNGIWTKPLSSPMSDVILHNNQFIVTDEAGRLYGLDMDGNELWSVNHPVIFRSVRAVGNGFAACVRTTTDATLKRLASDGTEMWSKTTADKSFYEANGASDGGIVAVGTSAAGNIVLVKFDAAGNEVWRKEYGTGSGLSVVNGIEGGFVVLGRTSSAVLHLIKTDGNGNSAVAEEALLNQRRLKTSAISAIQNPSALFFLDGVDAGFISNADSAGTIFNCSPWMAGLDEAGEIHLATESYFSGTAAISDYRSGLTDAPATDFNRVWLATREQVNRLRLDYGTDQTLEQPIPFDLLSWPGKGNPHFRYNLNFSPVTTDPELFPAPFVDANSDGVYNVFDGDYPLIKGDQMAWWVLTDSTEHTETGGAVLGFDLHISAYAYDCSETSLVDHSIFMDIKTVNRSGTNYDSTYMGYYTEFDMGCQFADYLGTLPDLNSVYLYGMFASDVCPGMPGFGSDVPVQSLTFLNQSMDHSMYAGGGSGAFINMPQTPQEINNFLQSKWSDGTPLTTGGAGNNPGSTDYTQHFFPDDPSNAQGWSMCTANFVYGDRRAINSHGPFTFAAGDTFQMTLQFTLHPDIPHPCPNITDFVQPGLLQLQQWNDEGALAATVDLGQVVQLPTGQSTTLDAGVPGASYQWSTGATTPSIDVTIPGNYSVSVTLPTGCQVIDEVLVQLASGIHQPKPAPYWTIQPNPARDAITISCLECESGTLQAVLRNAQGAALLRSQGQSNTFRLETRDLPSGLYWLELWQDGQFRGSKKLVLSAG